MYLLNLQIFIIYFKMGQNLHANMEGFAEPIMYGQLTLISMAMHTHS